jgi:ABC-2 type transport system ATP-binding protein
VSRSFGKVRAVDGVDLTVPAGTICALLGANGAGKTTLIRILTTVLRADRGVARVLGHDVRAEPAAVRARIGLTGQFASVDEDLTGHENLVLLARLRGHRRSAARARADELLEAFGLTEAARRRVSTYSGGMRRRLDLAVTVVAPPDLLVLDEPTTGLDPRSSRQVWDLVRELAASGTTVLLTTQYLEEADRLADRVVVLDRGRVVASGTSAQLRQSVGAHAVRLRLPGPDRRDEARRILARTLQVEVRAGEDPDVLATAPAARRDGGAARDVSDALTALLHAGIEPVEITLAPPSLDEVFLALTGPERAGAGEPAGTGVRS